MHLTFHTFIANFSLKNTSKSPPLNTTQFYDLFHLWKIFSTLLVMKKEKFTFGLILRQLCNILHVKILESLRVNIHLPLTLSRRSNSLSFSFLAQAFLNPENYNRQSIELAGDIMNGHQLSETFSKVLGRPMKYEKMKLPDESSRLRVQWIENNKFLVDVEALKKEHGLNLKTVEDFIRENKDAFE